jgi:hypothetical protein
LRIGGCEALNLDLTDPLLSRDLSVDRGVGCVPSQTTAAAHNAHGPRDGGCCSSEHGFQTALLFALFGDRLKDRLTVGVIPTCGTGSAHVSIAGVAGVAVDAHPVFAGGGHLQKFRIGDG